MTEAPEAAFEAVEDDDGEVHLYVVFGGVRIAERGKPDTPQAKQWVSLEPGFTVRDKGSKRLIVEFNGVRLQ